MAGAHKARPTESSFNLVYHVIHAKEFSNDSNNKAVSCRPSYLSKILSHLHVCMLNPKSRSSNPEDKFSKIGPFWSS